MLRAIAIVITRAWAPIESRPQLRVSADPCKIGRTPDAGLGTVPRSRE
jgi:hypothetical protein